MPPVAPTEKNTARKTAHLGGEERLTGLKTSALQRHQHDRHSTDGGSEPREVESFTQCMRTLVCRTPPPAGRQCTERGHTCSPPCSTCAAAEEVTISSRRFLCVRD